MPMKRAAPGLKIEKVGDQLLLTVYRVHRGSRIICQSALVPAADTEGMHAKVALMFEEERAKLKS